VSRATAFFSAQELKADSAPNAVSMDEMMNLKIQSKAADRAAGMFKKDKYKKLRYLPCSNGKAGEFSCKNANLQYFIPHQQMESQAREGNDLWGKLCLGRFLFWLPVQSLTWSFLGWTSADGREFGLVGQVDGTAFVEVRTDGKMEYVGRLPTQTEDSNWRDIKVIGDHAYIGSEAPGHGLQIFDLNKLLTINSDQPKTFSTTTDLTAHFSAFGSSHNIVAHEATNTVFAVGTSRSGKCRAGLWMVDVSDPSNPQDAGCVGEDGYVHDAQCVIYNGPDTQYNGQEICFNYNEDTLTIVDITDRANPKQLSRITYNGASYTHQGWIATSDMRYLLLDDELDEFRGNGPASDGRTATYIADISDLNNPFFTGVYKNAVKSSDHNQYIIDGISYQSNYRSGLRVLDVSSIAEDPTGAGFKEIAYFDVHPEDDAEGGKVGFAGAWSVYPYFKSGNILVNSIERGVFSIRLTV
jgi:choice-of-anchor B domain-containing protein